MVDVGTPGFIGAGFAILQGVFSRGKVQLSTSSMLSCVEVGASFQLKPYEMEDVSSMLPWEEAVEWQSHYELLMLLRR